MQFVFRALSLARRFSLSFSVAARKMGLERTLVELSSEERTSRNLLIDGCPSAAGHDVNNQTN
jgi:hypothetical protein